MLRCHVSLNPESLTKANKQLEIGSHLVETGFSTMRGGAHALSLRGCLCESGLLRQQPQAAAICDRRGHCRMGVAEACDPTPVSPDGVGLYIDRVDERSRPAAVGEGQSCRQGGTAGPVGRHRASRCNRVAAAMGCRSRCRPGLCATDKSDRAAAIDASIR